MAPKTKKPPTPDELLAEVRGRGAAKTYAFQDYIEVVDHMNSNGYSYAKIAEFLTEKLGYGISRGQVYRAHQIWLEDMAERAQVAAEDPDLPGDVEAEDEYDFVIRKLAKEMLEHAEARAIEQGYPAEFGEHAIERAAGQIEAINRQRRADEAAADEADRSREENGTGKKAQKVEGTST